MNPVFCELEERFPLAGEGAGGKRAGLAAGGDHTVKRAAEFFEAGGRDDNRIPPSTNVFRDAKETATVVLLQIEHENLALNVDFFTLNIAN